MVHFQVFPEKVEVDQNAVKVSQNTNKLLVEVEEMCNLFVTVTCSSIAF